MTDTILAWHWIRADRTLSDGRPMIVGETITHDGPLVICDQGLHASERILDALQYAPGPVVCRVECAEIDERHSDKFVCRSRRVLSAIDATATLRAFARRVALDVAHLWPMPAIVREYLETGDEHKRSAAWVAAWAAASVATWAAASVAAWAAASDATWAAASAAAWAAASDAAWGKYNGWLTEMVTEAMR